MQVYEMLLFILWFLFFIQITDRLILDQKPVDGIVDKTKFVVRMHEYNLSVLTFQFLLYWNCAAHRTIPIPLQPPSITALVSFIKSKIWSVMANVMGKYHTYCKYPT